MLPPALRGRRTVTAIAALVGYGGLAAILTWPLVRHLTATLPGDPTGDTGVYIWNLWIFRHELLRHGHLPFSTEHMFAFTGGADFSLHNYTPLAGLAGTVLIPLVGVVGAFNSVMLLFLTLSGLGVFLLGRQIGLGRVSAWVAGALFIASPVVTARETAHLSLISTAPLPLFLWALLRTLDRPRLRMGALVGVIVAFATYADAYFGIYCVLMGAFVLAWRFLRFERYGESAAAFPRAARWLDVACLSVVAGIAWRILSGVTVVFVGSIRVGVRGLYTPMLLLVVFSGIRAWLTWPFSLRLNDPEARLPAVIRSGILSVAVCLVLLSPLLAGLAFRYAQGRLPETATYWRSSPRGVDLLAYMVPNPNHALFGHLTQRWLLPEQADAFPEYVASFSLFAFAVIAVAIWRHGLPRMWVAFTAVFALLSLGPFVHVGGVNTFVIGPWALLRYVPVIGMARSPSRMAILATLGLSLLFAFALQAWFSTRPKRGTMAVCLLGFLIALEILPAPRKLYSAEVPEVYRLVAVVGDEQGRLLELPTGIRDGISSFGDFNASAAFFQTSHRRPLIGGYLSRISEWRKRENRRAPILRGLHALSEGPGPLPDDLLNAARQSRNAFLRRSCLKYVIVDKRRASAELRAFAIEAIGLEMVHEDDHYELLTPAHAPACEPPPPGPRSRRRGVLATPHP